MSKKKEMQILDHSSLPKITYKDLDDVNPDQISFDQIKRYASNIRKYLMDNSKDPYSICVQSRGAMNTLSECLRIMYRMNAYYKTQYKKEYSIAKIERADEWFKDNKPDVKVTDGMRSSYAEMDEEYVAVKNKYDATYALLEYLKNKRDDFEHDLNLAKKQISDDYAEEQKAKYVNAIDEDYEDVS